MDDPNSNPTFEARSSSQLVDGMSVSLGPTASAITFPASSCSTKLCAGLKGSPGVVKARTVEELWRAITSFPKEVSKDESKAYLSNSGYA
jgi:hypothetical protein